MRTLGIEEALDDYRRPPSPYVFTTAGNRPVSGWSKAKARLDRSIASSTFPPWCFHDLRRAFATHACDQLHIPAAVADRCLNHVGSSTSSTISRVYARNEMFEERKDALERWAGLLVQAYRDMQAARTAAIAARRSQQAQLASQAGGDDTPTTTDKAA